MNFPPSDFEQFRQLIIMIRQGEIDLPIGKKSLKALDKMVNDAEMVATNNIVELAAKIEFSPASLTRLSKLLGFQGFNQFQLIFKQKNKIPNNFYSDGVRRLIEAKELQTENVYQQQLDAVVSNIKESVACTNDKDIYQAISMLATKRRVFIFGYRQSSAIANILRYGLALLRPNVQMLDQADHGVAIALSQLKKEDLLVVIGSAPYSNVTVKITSLAKKQQCQILAITDSALSPLNELATVAIRVSTSGVFYANSSIASCFFVEYLLNLTAVELGQSAINNLKSHEALLSKLDVSG